MKKFILLTLLLLVSTSMLSASTKRYGIASGSVTYHTSTAGNIMGISTHSQGTKKLYFKEYGNMEIQEKNTISSTMGKQESRRSLTKFYNGMVYVVDFDRKTITRQDMSKLMGDKNMQAIGQDMLKKMGGKKVGTGKVLGYPCEIWEAMGSKMWFYKGVLLKLESNMMGIKTSEVATKASFNKSIPDSKVTLPQYPIQTMDEMINKEMHRGANEANRPNPEQMKQVQDLLKGLGGMFGGK